MTAERQLSLLRGPRQRGVAVTEAPLEFALHCAVADTLRASLARGWWWSTVDHGEERPSAAALRLKRKGVQRGLYDILLIDPAGVHYWLELKVPGGRLSDHQMAFAAMLCGRNVPHEVAWGFNAAMQALKAWGAVRVRL